MRKILLALLLLAPIASQAQLTLDALVLDMNQDGGFDNAVLTSQFGGDADLTILLSESASNGNYNTYRAFFRPEFVFNTPTWGMQPTLSSNSKGSLLITSGNDAIGRGRWEQTLTVVYRNKQFVVGGFTYSYRDTLDPEAGGSCDLNLLTGKGVRNSKSVKTNFKPVLLSNWSDELIPEECTF